LRLAEAEGEDDIVSEGPSARAGRGSLIAILAAALFVELWLNRIVARLLRGDPMRHLGPGVRAVEVAALFLFEFVSVFAVALLALALVDLARSRLHRGPLRAALTVTGGIAAVLCAVGVFSRMSPRLHAQLYLSAIFTLVVLAIGTLAVSASRRLRAGIVLLTLPLVLTLVAALLQRMSPTGVLDPNASMLVEMAGGALVLCGLTSPVLLGPPGPQGGLAVLLGAIVLGGGLTLGRVAWDTATVLAAAGLGVSIPVQPALFAIYVIGAAAMAYTIGALLVRPGPERLRGVGLLLVCTMGLKLDLPYQMAATLLGVLCLMESAARPAIDAITREQLDAQLRHWASLVGSAQVSITGAPSREHGRIPFSIDGSTPGVLSVDRCASAIARVELCVGDIPERRPPFSVMRRGRSGLGGQAEGAVIATDDPSFDAHYVVRDHRGAGTFLLDAETRARIARLADGLISIWPQRGARFVGPALPPGDDGLPSLAQLLSDLRKRTGA
jgi:hypothetical protein